MVVLPPSTSSTWSVVVSSLDGQVSIWDLAENAITRKFKAHAKGVNALAVVTPSPSSSTTPSTTSSSRRLIITAHHDIKVWDMDTLSLVKSFTGHATVVTRLLVTRDGGMCVSAAVDDRYISAWNLAGDATDVCAGME